LTTRATRAILKIDLWRFAEGTNDMPKKPREMEKELLADGWILKDIKGSHHQYTHPTKSGKVTIPFHSGDIDPVTEKSIRKQAQLDKV
jgi:predicted RNA binding protein YcfA (HicA-like mRNA interferase family)